MVRSPKEGVGCSSRQVIENNAEEPMLFSEEDFDVGNMHVDDPGCTIADRSTLTVHTGGIYLITAGVTWQSAANGSRQLRIERTGPNNAHTVAQTTDLPTAGVNGAQTASAVIKLEPNDTIKAIVRNIAAGNDLDLAPGTTSTANFLGMQWLGPG
jgi:hypothetical protein